MTLKFPLKVSNKTFPAGTEIEFAKVPDYKIDNESDWSKIIVEGLDDPIIIPNKQINYEKSNN